MDRYIFTKLIQPRINRYQSVLNEMQMNSISSLHVEAIVLNIHSERVLLYVSFCTLMQYRVRRKPEAWSFRLILCNNKSTVLKSSSLQQGYASPEVADRRHATTVI